MRKTLLFLIIGLLAFRPMSYGIRQRSQGLEKKLDRWEVEEAWQT